MHFGLDDPLGDLSDESNESFFDDHKVATKRASLTKSPEKKSVTDVFNLSNSTPEIGNKTVLPVDKPPTQIKPRKTISFQQSELKTEFEPNIVQKSNLPKDSLFNDDDILNILGPKPEKVRSDERKKTEDPLINTRNEPLIVANVNVKTDNPLLTLDVPKEARRRRRSSITNLTDPLGLFTKENEIVDTNLKKESNSFADLQKVPIPKQKGISSVNTSDDLPQWLGGGSSMALKSESDSVQTQNKQSDIGNFSEIGSNSNQNIKIETDKRNTSQLLQNTVISNKESSEENQISILQQKLSQHETIYQNNFSSLQHQESQILIALQLKKIEEELNNTQKQQQEVVERQEKQFNLLLDKYFQRQQTIENNIQLHQDRINNHIQLLFKQQPKPEIHISEWQDKLKEDTVDGIKFHDSIVESLKLRHQEEMFLMEESYKKQIQMLEEQMNVLENKLKSEISTTVTAYEEKITTIKGFHENELSHYKEKLQKLSAEHAEELVLIKEKFQQLSDEMKSDYLTQLENLRKIKTVEQNIFSESREYSEKLNGSLEVLDNNSKMLIKLQEEVQSNSSIINFKRESSIERKEKEIEMMKDTLEKCREKAEFERTQLMSVIKSLELKLAEQSQNAKEDRWVFQQAAATLNARLVALNREEEFNRNCIEIEREQLKTLKESLLAEQDKIISQLTEEKLTLVAEKARFQTNSKLTNDFEIQKLKTEAETSIQVAKETTMMRDRERENLRQQLLEIENVRRQLLDNETEIVRHKKELEDKLSQAEKKIKESENNMQEAKNLEKMYNEKLKELQIQLSSITSREKKLAEEKLFFSREKLALFTSVRNAKKCSLCSADENLDQLGNHEITKNVERTYFPTIIPNSDASQIYFEMGDMAFDVSKEDT